MIRGTCTERGLTLSSITRQFTAGTTTPTSKGLNFATSSPSATSVGGAGLGNSPVSLLFHLFFYRVVYLSGIQTFFPISCFVPVPKDVTLCIVYGIECVGQGVEGSTVTTGSLISLPIGQSTTRLRLRALPFLPSNVSSEAATCPSQPKIQIFQSLIVLSTVSQVWQQCLTTIAIWRSPYVKTARHQPLLYGGEMKSARYSATLAAFSSSSTVELVR